MKQQIGRDDESDDSRSLFLWVCRTECFVIVTLVFRLTERDYMQMGELASDDFQLEVVVRESENILTIDRMQCLVDYFAQLRPKRWQEWEHKYSGLSTAQYIFLIMQDDLHFDDETIAAILDVKRVSVRSMRARIKKSER